MARQIFIKNSAGATVYTIDTVDAPLPGQPPNQFNSDVGRARVHCELNNRDHPSTPQYAVLDTGYTIYLCVCPTCGSQLP